MECRRLFFTWIFALSAILSGHAQSTGASIGEIQENEVFAPFVSQLEGEIRNNLIRLSWKDARDIQGPVYVYRSDMPFSAVLVLPPPFEVPYGTGSYLDEAETPGILHYMVIASDQYGRKYILPILNTNTASITVAPENVPGYAERLNQGARLATSAPNAPVPSIQGISVRTEEDRVIISFSGADREKNLLLYRSLSPITRQEDLLSALIIRQKASSPLIDYPLPGIKYYYALVYEEDLAAGLFSVRSGFNITGAVQIAGSERANSRNMPLPGLNLSAPLPEGFPGFISENPVPQDIIFSMERKSENTGKKETEVFPEDLARGGSGDEYQLRLIVQGYFALKEWTKAAEEFRRFLELPRPKDQRARAQFYLGQVYYFQKKLREALFQFLLAQEQYSEDCNSWIQAVLADFSKN